MPRLAKRHAIGRVRRAHQPNHGLPVCIRYTTEPWCARRTLQNRIYLYPGALSAGQDRCSGSVPL